MGTRYNKEYEQYYIYALEQFLIKTYGYSEHDAKVKVMQDFDEVKEDFEMKLGSKYVKRERENC